MSEAVICYPLSFLERPEDRSLLMELKFIGIDSATASLLLYRIWADFSTGKSDKRKISSDRASLQLDRDVLLMEDFCKWEGEPGHLVISALMTGFLRYEEQDGAKYLICQGFFPMNSAWCREGKSFQKRGGYSRSVDRQAVAVDREARERETLWSRNNQAFDGVDEKRRGDSLRFVMQVCRVMDLPKPADDELRSGVLRMGIEILDSATDSEIKSTLVWLIGNRSDSFIPRRLDQILRKWPEIVTRAKSETGN